MRKCAICHFSDCFLKLSSSSFSVSGSMAKVKVAVSNSCHAMLSLFFEQLFSCCSFGRTIQQNCLRCCYYCYGFRSNTFARKLIECIFVHAALANNGDSWNCQNPLIETLANRRSGELNPMWLSTLGTPRSLAQNAVCNLMVITFLVYSWHCSKFHC